MAKKKYVKPTMVSEEFVPNEYVAACAWEVGTQLTATCEGVKDGVTIKLKNNQGGNVWEAEPVYENGALAGGNGGLYPVVNHPGTYVFTGSIYDGHSGTDVTGEFYPLSQVQGGTLGGLHGSQTLCDCDLGTQTTALLGSGHHHLTNVKSKNHS